MRDSICFVLISVLLWQLIFVVHIVICEESVSPKLSHSAASKLQVKVDSGEDVADRTNPESSNSHRKISVNSGKSEQSDEDDKNTGGNTKENKASVVAGVQRRPSVGSSTNGTKRDSQLLLLLAARRRQLLTERLTSHLATIATFAQKPAKHNVTSAQLEIRDFNNTVIRRISLPDLNSSTVPENRFKNGFDQQVASSRPVLRVDSFLGRPTPQSSDSKSSEIKSIFNTKALQDAKIVRAGYLNSRRKPASDVVRFGHGTRKPLIDLSVISHETYGIPEFKKDSSDKSDSKEAEAILDPDEEFQVDESNHGIYLLNYSTNNSMIQNPNETIVTPISDPEFLNIDFTTIPTILENKTKTKNITSPDLKESTERMISNSSLANPNPNPNSGNDTKPTKASKTEQSVTTKQTKIDAPPKDTENNTLFLSDELYNHFRPLESELAVEDMAPFLFFGQKITMGVPKDNNATTIHLTPTKPTLYVRPQDKKRGTYRPATEKIKLSPEENEDEINENMDVSVVKNVIEKNKIRNTIKMTAPSRHGNLVNAYRKQLFNETIINTTTAPIIVDNSPQPSSNEEVKDSSVKIKDVGLNRTSLINLRNSNNRTYYNFRRKPAKLIQSNETVKDFILTIAPTTPLPSTVVYTAVVTSVSVTSSIKGQNKNDTAANSTISDDVLLPINITSIDKLNNLTIPETTVQTVEYSTTEKSLPTTSHRIQTIFNESSEINKNVNETVVNKYRKKPDRIRPTARPRIRFTPHGKTNLENTSQPSPTPFILYSEKSPFSPTPREIYKPVNVPQLPNFKYRGPSTTERIVKTEISSESPLTTLSANFKIPSSTKPANNNKSEISVDGPKRKEKCVSDKSNSSNCEGRKEVIVDIQTKEAITESNIFKISKDLSGDPKNYNNTDDNNSYLYVSNIPLDRKNNSFKNNGGLYEDNITTELNKDVEIHLLNESSHIVDNTNISLLDKKDPKEVLQRRNGDVLIEMEKTNMATYILAGLSFLPITIIIMFVLRHVFLKKTKDIDTDYEGYFQDTNVKKETQITTVARLPILPPTKPDEKWEFPRSKLRLQTLLGQGNFGQVWKAEADDLTGHDGLTRLVAVKTIKETASQKEKQELFHEICIMQKIGTHPNVVTLLACCTEQEPYLLIMEYVMCGKLLTYLRDRRSRLDRFQMPLGGLTSRDLTVFAYCVARGMDYLASKGIVHRDLAARNVLVDHNKLCKIADFGMSREVNPTSSNSDDKTCKPQRNALPVRWMAPEALLYSVYSHETDVWAYGVLLWEIVTLGSTPYATMSGREVLHMVTEGYRLERPAHCKPHLYQTMHACWHADPTQRPPFSEIKRQLSELLENEPTEGNYVDLESFYQDSSVYSDPSAIIENDGGISVEYSSELSVKLRKDELSQPSFHSSGTNLQRNFSSGNLVPRNANLRSEVFSSVRGGSHTTVGGFGIMDGGFSGRDGNFCERKAIEKLSGTSFHREREGNPSRENGHPGNSLISRNSFNGIGNQGRSGLRAFITKSGSSRSKRISEFECDI